MKTYEELLASMLERVPLDVDKREGSVLFTALAPAAAELAQAWLELQTRFDLCFVHSSVGEHLDALTRQFGVIRHPAVCAKWKITVTGAQASVGMRFGCRGLIYNVVEITPGGEIRAQCETPGAAGNAGGELIPVEYLDGMTAAYLNQLLVAGKDAESDLALKARFTREVAHSPFGGNIADYQSKACAIDGVGGALVVPPGLSQDVGTVKLYLVNEAFLPVDSPKAAAVQAAFCPGGSQNGLGLAPIGHKVLAYPATSKSVSLTAAVLLEQGLTLSGIKPALTDAVSDYLLGLRGQFGIEPPGLTVRISRLQSAMLDVPGVLDVQTITISGLLAQQNLKLGDTQVPVMGTLTLEAGVVGG